MSPSDLHVAIRFPESAHYSEHPLSRQAFVNSQPHSPDWISFTGSDERSIPADLLHEAADFALPFQDGVFDEEEAAPSQPIKHEPGTFQPTLPEVQKKRKGGRKPIYATAEERKQRNRQAQADFRERRTHQLEGRVDQLQFENQQYQQTIQELSLENMQLRMQLQNSQFQNFAGSVPIPMMQHHVQTSIQMQIHNGYLQHEIDPDVFDWNNTLQ